MKDSLAYSRAIQIKRISSRQVDFDNNLKKMKTFFVKQEYHSSLISANLERIILLNRINLITEKTHEKNQTKYLLLFHINYSTKYYQSH